MARHSAEVSALLYVGARRHLLSASWDRQLLVHDEALADGGRLLRSGRLLLGLPLRGLLRCGLGLGELKRAAEPLGQPA